MIYLKFHLRGKERTATKERQLKSSEEKSKMSYCASSLLYLVIAVSLTLVNIAYCASSESADIEVGGKDGWRVPVNNDTSFYTRWAADMRFHIGDSLTFVYRNDSVMVVDKYAYYHCNTSNPIYIFRNESKTLIKLDRPGPFYFISGTPSHCKNGQRLEVDVLSNSPPRPIIFPSDTPAPAPSSALSTSTIGVDDFAMAAATVLVSAVFHC